MFQKGKRLLSLLLAAAMILCLFPVTGRAQGATEVAISTYEQLEEFAANVANGDSYEGVTVRLEANLSLGGEAHPWTPIGFPGKAFQGVFDGNHHEISGLYMDTASSNAALFAEIGSKATVKNLVVSGTIQTTASNAAGIAAANKGTIENCGSRVDITAKGGSLVHYCAGIAADNSGKVTGCFFTGEIQKEGGSAIGGIVGRNMGGTVTDCYNAGSVNSPSGSHVGGLVGQNRGTGAAVSNSYNIGKVSGKTNVGAVIGQDQTSGDFGSLFYLYGSASYGVGSPQSAGNAKSEAEMKDAAFLSSLGGAFQADSDNINGGYPILSWQTALNTSPAVVPLYAGDTENAAQYAKEIRAAVLSAKQHGGLTAADSLLNQPDFLAGASSTDTDWMALAMARFGFFAGGAYHPRIGAEDEYAQYLDALKAYIEDTYRKNGGKLHNIKATEWHRAIVTILALGGDPTNFGTYNGKPINLVADGCYNCTLRQGPGTQGINGWIWGLIALDSGMFEVPADAKYPRKTFIEELLKLQLTDGVNGNQYGGWVLAGYGSHSDADITAMALQALAPYYSDDTVYTYENSASKEQRSVTVRQCVDEALECLAAMMDENTGAFTSWGSCNVEGAAQTVVALCALGIDPAKDARFQTASGKTPLDGLMAFKLKDGGFCHVLDGGWNAMATDQAAYALVAYWRLLNGMRTLYDMRSDMTSDEAAKVQAAMDAIGQIPAPGESDYKAKTKTALTAFRQVSENERRYVRNYSILAEAIDLVGGEAALSTDAPYIISIRVKKNPDKTTYNEREIFSPAGMEIEATYSDHTTKPLTEYRYSTKPLTLSDTTIFITYGSLKTSLTITVLEVLPWEEAGTAEDPYLIQTVSDLVELSDRANGGKAFAGAHFRLTADLDMTGVSWVPIGYNSAGSGSRVFAGHFDGQGHVLKNLTSLYGGLFGYVADSAVIENVGIAGGTLGQAEDTVRSFVGGIAGWSDGADIVNCWDGADIYAIGGYCAGIVGTVRGGPCKIEKCYNTGAVWTENGDCGGIVGHIDTAESSENVVTIESCYNVGALTANNMVGGIAGRIQNGHAVRNCYSACDIVFYAYSDTIWDSAGALIGSCSPKNEIVNCYYDSDRLIENRYWDKTFQTAVGGLAQIENAQVTGKTAEEMKAPDFVALLGSAFQADPLAIENGGYPLLAWQSTENTALVAAVMAQIDALSPVTLDSAQAIAAARRAYEALPEALKPYVRNLDVLTAAEATLQTLASQKALDDAKKAAVETLESYKAPSDYRPAEQEALKQIIEAGRAAIEKAATLEEVEQALAGALARLDAVKTAGQLADEEAAQAVQAQIAAIGTVTLEKEDAIRAARRAYDALTDSAKALVKNLDVLTAAEAALAQLQANTPATGDGFLPVFALGVLLLSGFGLGLLGKKRA